MFSDEREQMTGPSCELLTQTQKMLGNWVDFYNKQIYVFLFFPNLREKNLKS